MLKPWAWAAKATVFKCWGEKHPALSPHTNLLRSRGEYLKVPNSLQIKLPGHAQNVSWHVLSTNPKALGAGVGSQVTGDTDRTKDQADKRHSGTKIGGKVLSKAQRHGVMRDDKLLGAWPAWKMLRACPDCGLDCRESIRAVKHGLI